MKRLVWMFVFVWAFAGAPVRGEDGGSASQRPAVEQPKTAEGCMPGGGCCGACVAARAQAQMQQGQLEHGQAPKLEDAGGCPCKRAQQKSM